MVKDVSYIQIQARSNATLESVASSIIDYWEEQEAILKHKNRVENLSRLRQSELGYALSTIPSGMIVIIDTGNNADYDLAKRLAQEFDSAVYISEHCDHSAIYRNHKISQRECDVDSFAIDYHSGGGDTKYLLFQGIPDQAREEPPLLTPELVYHCEQCEDHGPIFARFKGLEGLDLNHPLKIDETSLESRGYFLVSRPLANEDVHLIDSYSCSRCGWSWWQEFRIRGGEVRTWPINGPQPDLEKAIENAHVLRIGLEDLIEPLCPLSKHAEIDDFFPDEAILTPGESVEMKIVLENPAPKGGAKIKLQLKGDGVLPSNIVVPEGERQSTVTYRSEKSVGKNIVTAKLNYQFVTSIIYVK